MSSPPAGLLAAHSRVSVPVGAVVALVLGLLSFDFTQGLAAFAAHAGLWLAGGAAIALLTSLVLARVDVLPLAVACGAALGAGFGLVRGLGGEALLLHALAGVVVGALVQLMSKVEAEDVAPASLMALFFFLVIATFWIAKPIKKGLLIGWYKDHDFHFLGRELTGAGAEQVAKVGNMVFAVLLVALFTWLSRRLTRERLVFVFSALFTVVFIAYALVLARPSAAGAWSFYIAGDMFNTAMVAAFFAFLNDSVVPAQARRIYALVVFGGVLGGAFGATAVRSLQKALGDQRLMLVAAAATALTALVAWLAARRFGPPREGRPTSAEAQAAGAGAGEGAGAARRSVAVEGAALVVASRFLLCLVAIVGIYEFCSATLDYQWTATHEEQLASEEAIKSHQRTVYAVTTWGALLVQLLLTGPVLRRLGVGVALLVLPVMFLLNSSAFLLFPTVLLAAGLSVTDNSFNYSLNQSAREALYTPTSREEKYKAKAFIDMFVQRFAKAIAVGLALVFNALGPAWARWLSLPVLALLVVWILAARYAGRRFRELSTAAERAEAA